MLFMVYGNLVGDVVTDRWWRKPGRAGCGSPQKARVEEAVMGPSSWEVIVPVGESGGGTRERPDSTEEAET